MVGWWVGGLVGWWVGVWLFLSVFLSLFLYVFLSLFVSFFVCLFVCVILRADLKGHHKANATLGVPLSRTRVQILKQPTLPDFFAPSRMCLPDSDPENRAPDLGCGAMFLRPRGRRIAVSRGLFSLAQMGLGQNQWYHFGVSAPPVLVHFSGDRNVHWGYGILTPGQIYFPCLLVFPCWSLLIRPQRIPEGYTLVSGYFRLLGKSALVPM